MTTSSQARIAAYESWARTLDRAARTAPAVRGLAEKFTREARERLGPDATEKQVADAARKAHYTRLSAAGHAAKQARRAAGGCLAQLPVGLAEGHGHRRRCRTAAIVILQCCQPTGIIAETPACSAAVSVGSASITIAVICRASGSPRLRAPAAPLRPGLQPAGHHGDARSAARYRSARPRHGRPARRGRQAVRPGRLACAVR